MTASVVEGAFRTCGRAPAAWLRPYVSAYTGYRQEAGPSSVHQGVASAHLTFLFCLDGRPHLKRVAVPAPDLSAYAILARGMTP